MSVSSEVRSHTRPVARRQLPQGNGLYRGGSDLPDSDAFVHQPMEVVAVGRARGELGPVLENHDVLAVKPRLQLTDPFGIHDGRAVHPNKPMVAEPDRESLEWISHLVRVAADMQTRILAVRLDPVDLGRLEEEDLAARLDYHPVQPLLPLTQRVEQLDQPLVRGHPGAQ